MIGKMKKPIIGLVGCLIAVAISGCNDDKKDKVDEVEESPYAFVFKGSATIENVNYTLALNADSNGEFEFTISNMEPLFGNWLLVAGKGYEFTFIDANDTLSRTAYDVENGDHILKYKLNLGTSYGMGNVKLRYHDSAFAYDGEGFPIIIQFEGAADFMGMTTVDAIAILNPDGTVIASAQCGLGPIPNRNGTYTYDEVSHTYILDFEPANSSMAGPLGTHFESTYDEVTFTYTISIEYDVFMPVSVDCIYVVE